MTTKQSIARLKKKIGDGVITVAEQKPLEVISTGITPLDIALGVGGLPRGQITHIWGSPSSSKTSLVNHMVGELQKRDKEACACYIDIEHSLRAEWLAKFGIDPDRTVIVSASTIEDAMNDMMAVMAEGIFDIVVVDSIGALVRSVEIDGKDGKGADAHDASFGGVSALVTRWVKAVNSTLIRMDNRRYAGEDVKLPAVVFINQQRDDIGSMFAGAKKFSGGNALQHQMYINIRLKASGAAADKMYGTVNGKRAQVGTLITANIEKNKAAAPFRLGSWQFVYDDCPEYEFGVQQDRAKVDSAIEYGIVKVGGGGWIIYPDENGEEQRIRSRDALVALVKENPSLGEFFAEQVIKRVRSTEVSVDVKED